MLYYNHKIIYAGSYLRAHVVQHHQSEQIWLLRPWIHLIKEQTKKWIHELYFSVGSLFCDLYSFCLDSHSPPTPWVFLCLFAAIINPIWQHWSLCSSHSPSPTLLPSPKLIYFVFFIFLICKCWGQKDIANLILMIE